MTTHIESIGELGVMGDIWNQNTQFQYNNNFTHINMIAHNYPLMCLEGSEDNVIDDRSSRVATHHAPFLLPDLTADPNNGFELDGPIMLSNILDPGHVSPYLLPPTKFNIHTKSIQPQPRTNKARRQTTQDQIKHKSILQKEEENSFIQSLRSQNVPWKEISRLFFQRFGKVLSNASLQMRMLRRRKRAGVWRDSDIKLLHEAYDYWERKKFALIATKLQELGASQTYTERQVTIQLEHSRYERAKDDSE